MRTLHLQVIGLDVEHHGYRSYLGLTCLIQISSHNKVRLGRKHWTVILVMSDFDLYLQDYLVDPLPLWAELSLLNEITADPKIVKVEPCIFPEK